MKRNTFESRTLAPGIPTDGWIHDGDKEDSMGTNPRLAVDASISSPMEVTDRGGKGLAVFIQDQQTSILDLDFTNHQVFFQLQSPTETNSRVFTAVTGHGIQVGDVIEFFKATNVTQARVLTVSGDTITTDNLIGDVYPTGVSYNSGSRDMRVDGSTTPVVFSIRPTAIQSGDFNAVKFIIMSSSAMDFSKFGSGASLTNGCLLRYKKTDGSFENIFNFKNNGDLVLKCFQHFFNEGGLSDSSFSFISKATFNGQSDNGVTIRLDGALNEELQVVIQDNLQSLNQVLIQASVKGSTLQG